MIEDELDIDDWLKLLAKRLHLRSDFNIVMPEIYMVKRALSLAQVAEW